MKIPIRLSAAVMVLLGMQVSAEQASAAESNQGSVAIISSVNGEARIAHPTPTQQPDQPKFRGPIIYGDQLSTAKDATLGLLVGQNSLLTMRELTDVRIAETVRNQQILEMAKGKVCIAVGRQGEVAAQPIMLRTPASMITVPSGTLLSVEVEPALQKSQVQEEENGHVFLMASRTQPSNPTSTPMTETYQVVEGSVDIVSLASNAAPVALRTGQALRVAGGMRGQPFTAPTVKCRAEDAQIIPVHTQTPPAAQRLLVQQQMRIVGGEQVAAQVLVSGGSSSGNGIPNGIYLPFPTDNQTTRATIQVTLP